MFVRIITGSSPDASNSDNAPVGKWHNIVVTRNSSNKVDSYVDARGAKRLFADVAQVGSFEINRLGNDDSNLFDGKIDNVNIFSQAMSTSQIQQSYYAGLNNLLVRGGFDATEYGQKLGELKTNLSNNE